MSVFLTPDLQPFLGGTYFPPGWHFEAALFTVRDAVHPGLSVYVIILMLLLCLCCRGRLWPPRYSSSQPACTMHAGMHGQHRDHSLTIFCHVWLSSHELFTSLMLRAMRCAGPSSLKSRGPVNIVCHCTGFRTVLKRIAEVWDKRRADIKAQSADTMRQLAEATRSQGGSALYCIHLHATAGFASHRVHATVVM